MIVHTAIATHFALILAEKAHERISVDHVDGNRPHSKSTVSVKLNFFLRKASRRRSPHLFMNISYGVYEARFDHVLTLL